MDKLQATLKNLNETMLRIESVLQESRPLPANLTVQQAAKALNVSPDVIYDACDEGRLRHRRYGKGRGTIRIKRPDLEAWDETCCVASDVMPLKHLRIDGAGTGGRKTKTSRRKRGLAC